MNCPDCAHDNREGARFCGGCGLVLSARCASCDAELDAAARFCDSCGAPVGAPPSAPSRGTTPVAAPAADLPASFADGRYQVKRFLGEGGRKRVYLAHDEKLDRDVAFAVIKTEGLDADGLTRVRREAQAMGRLGDHPHIVTVFDTGEEGGQAYIVSRYLAGGSVEDLIARSDGRRLPVPQAIQIAEEVSRAMEHAHAHGIVHRDLKPGNVWLSAEGTSVLGDFGLAMALDRSRMTAHGLMVGTVAYMPPEQALGRQPDARSDLYSLGAMLYEMVTGRPPFLGDDPVAIISQHINTPPIDPSWHNPEIPKSLEALILRLLAKAPDERPSSTADVVAELKRIADTSTQRPVAEEPAADVSELQAGTWGRFVGRGDEMVRLKAALEAALSGRGSMVMLVGEPGIGKSRLAREFSVYASLRGAQVLTGYCYEGEVTVPYLPFVQALRQYVRGRADPALRQELGSGAPEVAKLVSEVRERLPDIPEAPPLEGEAERLRLFDSVTRFVSNVSASEPVVLFLDDIHWADKPSLLLLQYVARNIRSDRVLVVCAYRDVELDRTHPLSDILTSLRREKLFQRVLLRGMPPEDVRALVTAAAQQSGALAQPLTDEFTTALHQETEGNPFFVEEVIKHLVETGAAYRVEGAWTADQAAVAQSIPEGVREVIGRRLSRLSDGCNHMLSLASTMTAGFTFDLLAAVSGETEERMLDLMDEALRALVIRERRETGSGTYEFNHALMRQTLYGELNTPRRVRLHRQVGEAMERVYSGNVEPHLPALAYHFFQAAPGGDVEKAVDYATRAAERALSLTAYEEAAGLYDTALQALDLTEKPDEARRCELLLLRGEALNSGGARDKAKAVFERAAELARRLGRPQELARAALGFAGQWGAFGETDEYRRRFLEETLEKLPREDSVLRTRVLCRIAWEFWMGGAPQQADAPSAEAVEIARRVGDPGALAYAIWSRLISLWGTVGPDDALAAGAEIVQLAEQAGDMVRLAQGHFVLGYRSLELGRLPDALRGIDAYARLAEQLRQHQYLGYTAGVRAMFALLEGRFNDAEELAGQAEVLGERSQDPLVQQTVPLQRAAILRERGLLDEMVAEAVAHAAENQDVRQWQAWLAVMFAEAGRQAEVETFWTELSADDFAWVAEDTFPRLSACLLGEVCAYLRDVQRAPALYELILPDSGRNLIYGVWTVCHGSPSRHLGLLAALMERWDDAERHFRDALEMNERIKSPPLVAWTRYDYADMLLRRDADGDRKNALALLAEALDTAQELGMKLLLDRALKLKLKAQGIDITDIGTSIDTVAREALAEQPDLKPHAAPDGTVTIMFSDIEGSTVLTERLGDERWMEVLREHNAIVRKQVKAHGGFEVKSEGDGFMVAFQSARKAIQCAADVQKVLAGRNRGVGASHSDGGPDQPTTREVTRTSGSDDAPGDSPLRTPVAGPTPPEAILVRIGLHAGEVIKEGEDFFGRNVIMAARVASQARGGEILASSVLKTLHAGSDVSWGESRTVSLKGLSGKHEIWAVEWAKTPAKG